jgi:hypothetical protein
MTRTSRLKNKAIIMKINRKQMEIVMVEELDDVTPVRYPTFARAPNTHTGASAPLCYAYCQAIAALMWYCPAGLTA